MLTVRDIMTRDVTTVSAELSLRDAVDLFATKHVSGAPVMAGERPVGVLSTSDILAFEATTPGVPVERPAMEVEELVEPTEWVEGEEAPGAFFSEFWSDAGADVLERFAEVGGPEWDQLAEHTVAEAMSRAVCSVRPSADVYAAADYMLRAGVHRLLVMDAGRLVGILSSMDIVRAVAARRLVAAGPERRAVPRPRADLRR
jgi:CBS domain-containing protein